MNNIPKLRFKEFSGEWENKKLGDIIEYKKGYAFKSNSYKDEGVRIIKISDTSETSIKDTDITCISKEEAHYYREWKLQTNDIIVSTVGSRPPLYSSMVGKIILIPKHCEDTLLNQNLVRLRTNKLSTQVYLYTYLNSKRYLNYIEGICRGNANQVSITLEDLFEYKVRLPKIEEQEKIASFFSLIDDKISLQGEKVKALKDYKKGIMQKIFSRELRFKDDKGRDYPEWKEKKLNELGDTYTGLSGKTKENFGIGDAKYVVYKNVFGNTLANVEEVDLVEINEGENHNKVVKGDLLFTTSSETPEEVGMISCWNYEIDDLYLNSFCFGYRLFDLQKCSPIFMAYLLRSEAYRIKISVLGQGSTRYNISKTEIMKMKVSVPNIEEQRKIVSLLLKIESKLEKEQEKLVYLNQYKKGLLQQMFV